MVNRERKRGGVIFSIFSTNSVSKYKQCEKIRSESKARERKRGTRGLLHNEKLSFSRGKKVLARTVSGHYREGKAGRNLERKPKLVRVLGPKRGQDFENPERVKSGSPRSAVTKKETFLFFRV